MIRRSHALRAPDAEALPRGHRQVAKSAPAPDSPVASRLPDSPAAVLELQRTVGNARASRLLSGATTRGRDGSPAFSRLPNSPAAILELQRTVGNARVSRLLSGAAARKREGGEAQRTGEPGSRIQRDPAPANPGGPAQQGPGEEPKGGPDPAWAAISKLIAEQLGEDKIKEYAKSLAGKGVDLLIAQVKDATTEKDFVAASQGVIGLGFTFK